MANAVAEKMRVDKWLWCVRIYKSRSIATDACKANHVSLNEQTVKPSTLIKPGDELLVKKDGFNFRYKILALLPSRVGALIARECYQNLTPEEELNKFEDWYIRKTKSEFREKGLGRPTKKDRRNLDKLKDNA
jgi:ribosome-associated heat shock protein Hsp15